MCTAVSFVTKDHYFGRNLDYEFSYEESVVITPRNYDLLFRNGSKVSYPKNEGSSSGFAIIGMAYVVDNYPLYYDAVNEAGLAMAGLLFSGNAVYSKEVSDEKENIASFELILRILRQCKNVLEAKKLLSRLQIMDWAFSEELPPSSLHWMIADKKSTIVVEAVVGGVKIYDNPIHVLTNNPSFPYQMMNLSNYMGLSAYEPGKSFDGIVELYPYSRGMGAIGLPGDLSSSSRFIKAAFTRMNSICDESEEESLSQFFHILGSVWQQRGCVRLSEEGDRKYEITIYSCCCNTDKGIYYYVTYDNWQITAVNMHHTNLEAKELQIYPMNKKGEIKWQN